MKRLLAVAAIWPLLASPAFAQAAVTPTPSLSATSPLGMGPTAPVGGAGIPLGATEVASPGVSPVPNASTGTVGNAGCATVGTSASTMFGSTATFDGGGTSLGTVAPATGSSPMSMAATSSSPMSTGFGVPATSAMVDTSGMSGMCGSGSGNLAASSTPTSPLTPGGVGRTGVPLDSTEISNLGVSSAAAVPTMTVAPTIGEAAPTIPMVPVVTSPPPIASPTIGTGSTTSIVPGLAAGASLTR